MDDDKHDDATSPSNGSRKRTPPTIDLTASSVSDSAASSGDGGASAAPSSDPKPRKSWRDKIAAARAAATPSFRWPSFSGVKAPKPARAALSSMLLAGFTGAVAAILVLGAYWFWDSSGGSSRILSRLPQSTAKTDRDSPGKQIAKVEPRTAIVSATPPQDAVSSSRLDALDQSIASLRDEVAALRASLDELKAAASSRATETGAAEERISKIERATVALTGDVGAAQKSATDDPRLRRVAIAATLDAAINRGEPYAVALSAAKSSAEDASLLKPLDEFAERGIPAASSLNRELITLLPQLTPKTVASSPSGLLDRVAQSASKALRIRRVDDDEIESITARAASAARRDDLAAARREVEPLSGSARAQIAPWIDKVDAREAALAASRQFASNAASALPKLAQ